MINKPAPLPMHPGGRFNRNTLQYILNSVYRPQKPRPAHRLDANTTGVVLLTRTRHFAEPAATAILRGQSEQALSGRGCTAIPRMMTFFATLPSATPRAERHSRNRFRFRLRRADGIPCARRCARTEPRCWKHVRSQDARTRSASISGISAIPSVAIRSICVTGKSAPHKLSAATTRHFACTRGRLASRIH